MSEEKQQLGKVVRYRRDGVYHCANGPAVLWEDGSWAWLLYGNQHRYYGPWHETGSWYIHGGLVK